MVDAQQRYLVSCFVLLFAGVVAVLFYNISSPWMRDIEADLWVSSLIFYLFRFVVLIKVYCENGR